MRLLVGYYQYPSDWVGWVEPDDLSWILFINKDGSAKFFGDRDPITGAVR